MWTSEDSIIIKSKPEVVWKYWSDPNTWSQWDPDIVYCKVFGEFKQGNQGVLKPKNGPEVKFTLTHVEPHKSFIDEAKLLLATLSFSHSLQVVSNTHVRITHKATITGPLSFLFVKLMGKNLRRTIPLALDNLAALAAKAQ